MIWSELEARAREALENPTLPPAPWTVDHDDDLDEYDVRGPGAGHGYYTVAPGCARGAATLLALSREFIPAALAEVERLRSEVERLTREASLGISDEARAICYDSGFKAGQALGHLSPLPSEPVPVGQVIECINGCGIRASKDGVHCYRCDDSMAEPVLLGGLSAPVCRGCGAAAVRDGEGYACARCGGKDVEP